MIPVSVYINPYVRQYAFILFITIELNVVFHFLEALLSYQNSPRSMEGYVACCFFYKEHKTMYLWPKSSQSNLALFTDNLNFTFLYFFFIYTYLSIFLFRGLNVLSKSELEKVLDRQRRVQVLCHTPIREAAKKVFLRLP